MSTTEVLCAPVDVEHMWRCVGTLGCRVLLSAQPDEPYRTTAASPSVVPAGSFQRAFLEFEGPIGLGLIHDNVVRRHTGAIEWYIEQRIGAPHIMIDLVRLGRTDEFGLVRVYIMRWAKYFDYTIREDYKPDQSFFDSCNRLAKEMKSRARRHLFSNGRFWVTAEARAVLDEKGWPDIA